MIRKFALVFGIVYLLASVAGLMPGLLPVDPGHNLAHAAIGIWGIAASRRSSCAMIFARGLALIYGLLAVLELIPATSTLFGPGPDVWLHTTSALIAAYFGFLQPRGVRMTI